MARYPSTTVKRGSDGALTVPIETAAGAARDLSAAIVTSELRTAEGALIDTLACTIVDAAAGIVRVGWTNLQSADWPLTTSTARALFDIRLNEGGVITYTGTAELLIQREITHG